MHALPAKADAVRTRASRREELFRLLSEGCDQRSGRTQENLRRLLQPETLIVTANVYPCLFGGPAFQLLKCMTAIKVCDELMRHAIIAVPVCLIHAEPPKGFAPHSIHLLDSESEIHCLQLPHSYKEVAVHDDTLLANHVSSLLTQIEELGRGTFDQEIIEILKASYKPDFTLTRATALLFAALTEEWGMIVLNPDKPQLRNVPSEVMLRNREADSANAGYFGPVSEGIRSSHLIQSSTMPVIACVIDPGEAQSFIEAQAVYDQIGLAAPLAWPQASATMMDLRSRRTLERYGLNLHRLYSGEESIIRDFQNTIPGTASQKLDSLKAEAETRIYQLRALDPAGKKFGKAVDSGREKIVFQINKLREHFDAARDRKIEIARRQIHRACNLLAPNRRVQEQELAGIQMVLRYSRAGLHAFYEKLDILNLEHQIILMD